MNQTKTLRTVAILLLIASAHACGGSGQDGADGADGVSLASSVSTVDAGDICAAGGIEIQLGADDNANGRLDDGEADQTEVICNGADGEDGADGEAGADGMDGANGDGNSSLIEVTAEPAGANCSAGGQRVDVGLDNGDGGATENDGVLADSEIDSTNYVCDGVDGYAVVTNTSAVPAGGACESGGVRIDIGVDNGDNGEVASDGNLGVGEIDQSETLCDGADGTNGALSLVSLANEPAGANCVDGGTRIDAGLDNGDGGGTTANGNLEAGEVDSSTYACAGTDGTDGATGLVLTAVEFPSVNCPNGGTRVDSGLDNGDGNGTAGNASLEGGEIDNTTFVCDGDDGIDGLTGFNGLVRTTDEPAGPNCEFGGQKVDSGLDGGQGLGDARDNILSDDEVDSTTYVCNGLDGYDTLFATTSEPIGPNCADAGIRIDTGLDNGDGLGLERDGLLDADEIDDTSYICNGPQGVQGFSGIVTQTTELAGANCADGGTRVDSGLDNGDGDGIPADGILQAEEIDDTSYVCDGAQGAPGAQGFAGLVTQSPEAVGANCAFAGVRVDSGLDNGDGNGTAGDNILSSGEFDVTEYVCNGDPGPQGTTGFSSLVTQANEPAGPNCTAGGIRVTSGLDNGDGNGTANDGTLSFGEWDSRNYVCDGAAGSGGGGGLSLVDANSTNLGTVLTVEQSGFLVRTPTGYVAYYFADGTFGDSQVYVTGTNDCSLGVLNLNTGSSTPRTMYGRNVYYHDRTSTFHVPTNLTNGFATSVSLSYTSFDNLGSCGGAGGPTQAWVMVQITAAAAGITASPVLPLTVQ